MTSTENSIQKISNLIGSENVIQNRDDLLFYSTDIFGTAKEQAVAVVRPANSNELIALVKLCIEENKVWSHFDIHERSSCSAEVKNGFKIQVKSKLNLLNSIITSLLFPLLAKFINKKLSKETIKGISYYGNTIGVPNVGGDLKIGECYNNNPLVNVACIGILKKENII